jgi:hypothetical protein
VSQDFASGSNSGAKLSKTTHRHSITPEEGAGAMMSGPLMNGSSQLRRLFNFHVLLHDRGAFFNFNLRRLLQLQSSSPT